MPPQPAQPPSVNAPTRTDSAPPSEAAERPDPPLALVSSVARNRAIGRDNELVWRHPEDLRWFRRQTLGCPVIMGRRTWDSLPAAFRPLPGRTNIVVTRQSGWQADGAVAATDLPHALQIARQAAARADSAPRRIAVIGGAQLYALALPLADELVLTEVDADFDADAWFPEWDRSAFEAVLREDPPAVAAGNTGDTANPEPGPAFRWTVYRRR